MDINYIKDSIDYFMKYKNMKHYFKLDNFKL